VDWVPSLNLGAISIFFRSDLLSRILLFSVLSFLLSLMMFYLGLLLLSIVNGRGVEVDPVQKMVRLHLGMVDRCPWAIKLLLPLLGSAAAWLAARPLLAAMRLIEPALSVRHAVEQAAVIGLGAYLAWKYLIGALLLLCLLATYVYLGNHALWSFVLFTGHNLVRPFRWLPLQIGKVDFAPLIEIVLVFLAAELGERGLTLAYAHLPI